MECQLPFGGFEVDLAVWDAAWFEEIRLSLFVSVILNSLFPASCRSERLSIGPGRSLAPALTPQVIGIPSKPAPHDDLHDLSS